MLAARRWLVLLNACCTMSRLHVSHEIGLLAWVQGIPEAPMCGFSNMACRILDAYGEPGGCCGVTGLHGRLPGWSHVLADRGEQYRCCQCSRCPEQMYWC